MSSTVALVNPVLYPSVSGARLELDSERAWPAEGRCVHGNCCPAGAIPCVGGHQMTAVYLL